MFSNKITNQPFKFSFNFNCLNEISIFNILIKIHYSEQLKLAIQK